MNESNRLPVLASEIRKAHADVQEAAKTAAQRAIDAGTALIEAKALCGRGKWLPFVKESGLHARTAQRYMTLASSRLGCDTVSYLGGITAALRFIAHRSAAMQCLDDAENAARAGLTGDDALIPLETFFGLVDEMVAMFPNDVPVRRVPADKARRWTADLREGERLLGKPLLREPGTSAA
jgi:hypothetical protein